MFGAEFDESIAGRTWLTSSCARFIAPRVSDNIEVTTSPVGIVCVTVCA